MHAIAREKAPPIGALAATAIGLELFLGVGALGGGLALMAGPRGQILPLPVSALAGSPFGDYLVPGVILFVVLGLGPIGAAGLAWRRHPAAPWLACAAGGALLVWLVVEFAIVGYTNRPPLQPFYLGLGAVITLVGLGWVRRTQAARAWRPHTAPPGRKSMARDMAWISVWAVLLVVSAAGLIIAIHSARFRGYVRQARRDLGAVPASREPMAAAGELPPPVARYRRLAVGDREPIKTLSLRHGGTFRTAPDKKPRTIRGEQQFSSDPPGYVWAARVLLAPGLWIDACDTDIADKGRMRVLLESSLTVADARGPAVDQGAALRLLAEMAWFPTALFDARHVRWSPIDDSHARATLRSGLQEVSCVFEFGPDGLPAGVSAERFMANGDLRPWSGTFRDYRRAAGMLVPFEVEVSWHLDSGPFPYAHWRVDTFEYDAPAVSPPERAVVLRPADR